MSHAALRDWKSHSKALTRHRPNLQSRASAFNMQPTDVLTNVLAGNRQIVSHNGTGQYQATSASTSLGTSACGLAALNCAREFFRLHQNYQDSDRISCCEVDESADPKEGHDKDRCLLYRCLSRQTTENVMAIRLSWKASTHLDVDEILDLPIFKHAFHLVETKYGQINRKQLWELLQQMASIDGINAAVITRPPEILLCLKTSVSGQTMFIIFDSHPRPSHPEGSGFTLNSTIEATADCLDDLLSIDAGILSDPLLAWQAQTLGQFSAHILVPRENTNHSPEINEILMGATTKVLQLMVEVAELKDQEMDLIEANEYLANRLNRLEWPQAAKGKGRAVETSGASGSGYSDFHSEVGTAKHRITNSDSSSQMLDSSEELAKSLQAQFDEEDRKITTERDRLQQRNKLFECGVCFETFEEDFVARIKGCKHRFCRDCLRQYATTTIEDRRYPILCPACLADNSEKPMNIKDDLLQTLGVSDSTYAIFQELQLVAHSVILHCRRCKETMFVDKKEYQARDIIVCPLRGCNHIWCKKCERSIERGGPRHSCDGSNELEHLVKTSGWRHCPGCRTVIQKESGCNHMTCASPRCNTHFCYVCGEMMTRSVSRAEIRQAVASHYRKCTMFDTPAT